MPGITQETIFFNWKKKKNLPFCSWFWSRPKNQVKISQMIIWSKFHVCIIHYYTGWSTFLWLTSLPHKLVKEAPVNTLFARAGLTSLAVKPSSCICWANTAAYSKQKDCCTALHQEGGCRCTHVFGCASQIYRTGNCTAAKLKVNTRKMRFKKHPGEAFCFSHHYCVCLPHVFRLFSEWDRIDSLSYSETGDVLAFLWF